MLKTLCDNRIVHKLTMETSLENNSDMTVLSEPSTLEDVQQRTSQNSPTTKPLSITEVCWHVLIESQSFSSFV